MLTADEARKISQEHVPSDVLTAEKHRVSCAIEDAARRGKTSHVLTYGAQYRAVAMQIREMLLETKYHVRMTSDHNQITISVQW